MVWTNDNLPGHQFSFFAQEKAAVAETIVL